MCNSIASGKGRCLPHQPASQYIVRSVAYKTGDRVIVTQTLSELSKEGKKMDLQEPTREEVIGWVEKERFAQQFDPSLDEHERKIQGNQLEKASAYVKENDVPANHFYAWKNLLKRVKANTKKRVMALGLMVGMTPMLLAGCFAEPGAVQPNTPTEYPDTNPIVSETYYGNPETGGLEGTGIIIKTDGRGEYETVKLPDDSPLYQLNKDVVDPAVYQNGFTDEDILILQKSAIDFIVKEAIDSQDFLDISREEGQYALHVGKYFTTDIPSTGPYGVVPETIRDGKPRIASHSAQVEKVWLANDTTIAIQFIGTVEYRTTNGAIVNLLNSRGFSNEEILSDGKKPELINEPSKHNEYIVHYDYSLAKEKGNPKFNGYKANFRDSHDNLY